MHKMEFISTGDILSYGEYTTHTIYKREREIVEKETDEVLGKLIREKN